MLSTKSKNHIIKSISDFNNFLNLEKEKNYGDEVGIILDKSSTWEENSFFTKAEFLDKPEKIVLYYYEQTKPNEIKTMEFEGIETYDGESLKDGLKTMKKIMRLMQKQKINESATEQSDFKKILAIFREKRMVSQVVTTQQMDELKNMINTANIDQDEKETLDAFWNILNHERLNAGRLNEVINLIENYTGKKVVLE